MDQLSVAGAATLRLQECPGWYCQPREFDMLYRHGSAGGSRLIRAHRKRVRDALPLIIDANPELSLRPAEVKPVTARLFRALDLGERGAVQGLTRPLSRVKHQFTWAYGDEKKPKALARKYAYCEILGPRGPVRAEKLLPGFVLLRQTQSILSIATMRSRKATSPSPGLGLRMTLPSLYPGRLF